MLEEAPHILQACAVVPAENDEYGRPVPGTGGESWHDLGECFCHDNSQHEEVSAGGRMLVYEYHVVHEGGKLPLDTRVRCISRRTGEPVGEGVVVKNAECYSSELEGRCDTWLL